MNRYGEHNNTLLYVKYHGLQYRLSRRATSNSISTVVCHRVCMQSDHDGFARQIGSRNYASPYQEETMNGANVVVHFAVAYRFLRITFGKNTRRFHPIPGIVTNQSILSCSIRLVPGTAPGIKNQPLNLGHASMLR